MSLINFLGGFAIFNALCDLFSSSSSRPAPRASAPKTVLPPVIPAVAALRSRTPAHPGEDKIQGRIDRLQAKIDRLENHLDRLPVDSESYDDLEDEIDDLQDELDDLQDEFDDLQDRLDEIEDERYNDDDEDW